jgi:hypothetical protein
LATAAYPLLSGPAGKKKKQQLRTLEKSHQFPQVEGQWIKQDGCRRVSYLAGNFVP